MKQSENYSNINKQTDRQRGRQTFRCGPFHFVLVRKLWVTERT